MAEEASGRSVDVWPVLGYIAVMADFELSSPCAGHLRMLVGAGDAVMAGQTVAVVEAMKMEAPIVAQDAGSVVTVHADGGVVSGGDRLLTIRADA